MLSLSRRERQSGSGCSWSPFNNNFPEVAPKGLIRDEHPGEIAIEFSQRVARLLVELFFLLESVPKVDQIVLLETWLALFGRLLDLEPHRLLLRQEFIVQGELCAACHCLQELHSEVIVGLRLDRHLDEPILGRVLGNGLFDDCLGQFWHHLS